MAWTSWPAPPFVGGVLWRDLPSEATPLDAANLNTEESAEATYAALIGQSVVNYMQAQLPDPATIVTVCEPPTGVIATDKANLLAAFTAWAAAGGILRLAPGVYKIDASLGTFTPPAGATIEGDGAVIDFSAAPVTTHCLTITGAEASSGATYQAVTVDATPGSMTVTVAAGAGYNPGDIVKLGSNDVFDPGQTNSLAGELNRVLSVAGTVVTLVNAVDGPGTYHAASGAYLAVCTMPQRPKVRGLTFQGGGAASQHVGLLFIDCEAPRCIENTYLGCEERASVFVDCFGGVQRDVLVDGSNYAGSGYGTSLNNATCDFVVWGGEYHNCGHAQTTANNSGRTGIPRRNLSVGSHAYNTLRDSFKAHPGCYSWELDNCWAFSPTDSGFVSYGAGFATRRCHVRRPGKYGAYHANSTSYATRLDIDVDVEWPTQAGIAVVSENTPAGAGQIQDFVRISGSVDNAQNYSLDIHSTDTWTFTDLNVDLTIRNPSTAHAAVNLQNISEGDFHFVGANCAPGRDFIAANNVRYSNFRFNATLGGASTGENALNATGCQHLTIAPDCKAVGYAVGATLDGTTTASINYAAFESAVTRTAGFTGSNTDRYAALTAAVLDPSAAQVKAATAVAATDRTNIQAAITAAAATALLFGHAVALVPAGLYANDQAITGADNVTLWTSPGTIIKRTSRNYALSSSQQAAIRADGATGFEVRGAGKIVLDCGDAVSAYVASAAGQTSFAFAHSGSEELFVYLGAQEQFSPQSLARGDCNAAAWAANGFSENVPTGIVLNGVVVTGDTTSGQSSIANLSSTTGVRVGAPVTGTNVAAGTTIGAVSGSTLTMLAKGVFPTATPNGTATVPVSSTSGISAGMVALAAGFPGGQSTVSSVSPSAGTVTFANTLTGSAGVVAIGTLATATGTTVGVTLTVGSVANGQVLTGTATSGSNKLTSPSTTAGVTNGQGVSAPGVFPANTFVIGVDAAGNIVVSEDALSTATGNVTVGDLVTICKTIRTNQHAAVYFANCDQCEASITVEGLWYDGIVFDACTRFRANFPRARGILNRGVYVYERCAEGQITAPTVDGRDVSSGNRVTSYGLDCNPTRYLTRAVQWTGVRASYCFSFGFSIDGGAIGCALTGLVSDHHLGGYGLHVQGPQTKENATQDVFDFQASNVTAQNCGTYGVFWYSGGYGPLSHKGSALNGCAVSNCWRGIYTFQVNDLECSDWTAHDCTSVGIFRQSCTGGTMSGILARDNAGDGIDIEDCFNIEAANFESYANGGKGILLFTSSAAAMHFTLRGFQASGNTGVGIQVNAGFQSAFLSGRSWGNTGANVSNADATTILVNVEAASTSVVSTDVGATLTASSSAGVLLHTGTLTANRTITLSATNVYDGASFRVVRSGSGAFTLSVGGLASLTQYQWCDVTYCAAQAAWILTAAGTLPGGTAVGYANYLYLSAAGTTNWTVPAGLTAVRCRAKGGGGGGGGAGSAAAAQLQAGASAGSAGNLIDTQLAVTPGHVLALTPGAGGNGGTGGAAGGNAGNDGSTGTATTVVDSTASATLVNARGGTKGLKTAASSTTAVNGAVYGSNGSASASASQFPGSGGASAGQSGGPFLEVVGGGGGGAATATLGGGGGNAQQSTAAIDFQAAGTTGASGTSDGVNGVTPTQPGCGGAGGGGGAAGTGKGGDGSAGARGDIGLYW